MQTVIEQLMIALYEGGYLRGNGNEMDDILEKYKEIEKEQLHKCASFWRGKENEIEKPIFEQYYNETFKN